MSFNKIGIIKRLEEMKVELKNQEFPQLIMIYFNWQKNLWDVVEQYDGFKKLYEVKHYSDYVFRYGVQASVTLELGDCPDDEQIDDESSIGLFCFTTDEVRNQTGIGDVPFSISYNQRGTNRVPDAEFIIGEITD